MSILPLIENMILYDNRGRPFKNTDHEFLWKCKKCLMFFLNEDMARLHSATCTIDLSHAVEDLSDKSNLNYIKLN